MRAARFLVVLFAACGPGAARPVAQDQGAGGPSAAPTAAVESAGATESKFESLDAAKFANPTRIDNAYLPLKPGMRYEYEGTTIEDDGTAVPHRVVITVTDLAKKIGGIPAVVSWDLDFSDGELVEAELAFFAQDDEGNVWRMGEHPEEYDEGKFVAAPTWIHGIADAKAGIEMRAKPQTGTPSYSQGWAPGVGFTDRGQVDQTGQKAKVRAGAYDDVVVIAEVSGAEPDAQQLKHFARGVGNVQVSWRGKGEKTKETLELVKIETLTPQVLADVRSKALALEQSAYKVSKDVYGRTPPAERIPEAAGAAK